jgi:hypothetical protein
MWTKQIIGTKLIRFKIIQSILIIPFNDYQFVFLKTQFPPNFQLINKIYKK